MSDNAPSESRNEVHRRRRWRSCNLNNKYISLIGQKRLRLIKKMERRARLLNEGNLYFKRANDALKWMVEVMGRGGVDNSDLSHNLSQFTIDRLRLYEVLRLLTGDVIQAIEMTSKMARTLTSIYNFLRANQIAFHKGGPRRGVPSVDTGSNTEKSYFEGVATQEILQTSQGSSQKKIVPTITPEGQGNSNNQISFEQQDKVGRKCLTVNPMVDGHVLSRAYVVLERLQLPLGDYSVPLSRLEVTGSSDSAVQQREDGKKPAIHKSGLDKEMKINRDKGKAKLRLQPRFSTRNMSSSPNKGRKTPIAIARPFKSNENEENYSNNRPVEQTADENENGDNFDLNLPGPSWALDSTTNDN